MKRLQITDGEIDLIRQVIGQESYAGHVYAHCMLGLHQNELCALKKDDITIKNGTITLKSTGRTLPCTPELENILSIRQKQSGTDFVFPRMRIVQGGFSGWAPLTPAYYRKKILRPLLRKLGIPEDRIICRSSLNS